MICSRIINSSYLRTVYSRHSDAVGYDNRIDGVGRLKRDAEGADTDTPFVHSPLWKSMQTAVPFLKVAHSRDLNLGLARSLPGDLKWSVVHSNGRAVVKDLTRTRLRPYGRYIKSEFLYLCVKTSSCTIAEPHWYPVVWSYGGKAVCDIVVLCCMKICLAWLDSQDRLQFLESHVKPMFQFLSTGDAALLYVRWTCADDFSNEGQMRKAALSLSIC